MRTIDADALKELFSEVIGHIAQKPEMNGNLEHMIRASAMVIQMIDDASTVQPECPKGRWIPTASGKGRHECSRCHEYAPCYQDGSEHLSTFCVLCGAKMEEGK